MLPEALLLLLGPALGLAQTTQKLLLNSVSSFSPQNIPNPPVFPLPKSNHLTITVALCSASHFPPKFFVTNSSDAGVPSSRGGRDVYEIFLDSGHGNWTGVFRNEGVLAIEDVRQTSFEVGVSEQGPIHEFLPNLPLLGDTTSNQALLFSPPFSPPVYTTPTYPNYSLPSANMSLPSPPSNSPNFTLKIFATLDSTLVARTACFLSSEGTVGLGTTSNEKLWLRDRRGWRNQWLIEALTPSTNYTAYVIQDQTKVSGPIYFATKSATFTCPLVFNLPYCPNVAYTVPLPPPDAGDATVYTASNVPDQISSTFLSYMTNFTVTLTTFACGRDWYSPVVGCDDCEREYRNWLCTTTFTRCGEPSPASHNSFTSSVALPSATRLAAVNPAPPQQVLSALVPQSTDISTARSPTLPAMGSAYMMLLPCLETCTAVDRACPNLIGFRCPKAQFNAAASYGVGYIDASAGDEGQGVTGTAQDRWGNLWCNGS